MAKDPSSPTSPRVDVAEHLLREEESVPLQITPSKRIVNEKGQAFDTWTVRVGAEIQIPQVLEHPRAQRVQVTSLGTDKAPREAYVVGLCRDEHDDVVAVVWYGVYFAGVPFVEAVHASRILPVPSAPVATAPPPAGASSWRDLGEPPVTLPYDGRSTVVLMRVGEGVRTGYYQDDEFDAPGRWFYTGRDRYEATPTAWMPIPEE